MPKRKGFLYDTMLDKAYIRRCILKGAEHKHNRWDVRIVLNNLDYYVDLVYEILSTFSYMPTIPRNKTIHDDSSDKDRNIGVQPFYHDGIIHQVVTDTLRPVIMKSMHYWSSASIPDRGGKHSFRISKRMIQKQPNNSRYVAELDIKQFYPSIPQKEVIKALRRRIKDKKFLQLVAVVISCDQRGQRYFYENGTEPEDIVGDRVGLQIGFYPNQWLANFYLQEVDRFALQQPGVKCESRYMDNINLFASNKRKLRRAVSAIMRFVIVKLKVIIKDNWQIFKICDKKHNRRHSAVGYRFARDYIVLRRRNFLRLIRQARRVKKKLDAGIAVSARMAQSLLSRIGQLKHCNSLKVLKKYIYPIGISVLKHIVKLWSRKQTARMKGAVIA